MQMNFAVHVCDEHFACACLTLSFSLSLPLSLSRSLAPLARAARSHDGRVECRSRSQAALLGSAATALMLLRPRCWVLVVSWLALPPRPMSPPLRSAPVATAPC